MKRCIGDETPIVVARISSLEVTPLAQSIEPGTNLCVRSEVSVRKRSLVTFRHRCCTADAAADAAAEVGSAEVICACVNSKGRAVQFPEWALVALSESLDPPPPPGS